MRPYRARFRGQGVFFAFQSWAGCITNIFGFDWRQAQPSDNRPPGLIIPCSICVCRVCSKISLLIRLDGRFPRLIDKLARVQLLILDDWGTHTLNDQQRLDLLEIFESKCQSASTM